MSYFTPYVDASGLHIPTYADIRDDIIVQMKRYMAMISISKMTAPTTSLFLLWHLRFQILIKPFNMLTMQDLLQQPLGRRWILL